MGGGGQVGFKSEICSDLHQKVISLKSCLIFAFSGCKNPSRAPFGEFQGGANIVGHEK